MKKKTNIKEPTIKEPVRIRYKNLNNGNRSIYLDIYIDGQRRYEFLKLYLVIEKTKSDKIANSNTLNLANSIKAKRIIELQNSRHGFFSSGIKSDANFIAYFRSYSSARKIKAKYPEIIIKHLIAYRGEKITFKHINKQYALGFINHLRNAITFHNLPLKPSSIKLYFSYFNAVLNKAVIDGIMVHNPISKIAYQERPKGETSQREYLTIDELKKMADTPCENEIVRRAFLFSCYCGLRLSDVRSLKWDSLTPADDNGSLQLVIRQQKTGELIHLPLPKEAVKQLRENNSEYVFSDLLSPANLNIHLQKWTKAAGIKKHISFHVARHTYATMLITFGADLYTVSKLLGHKNVATTQIYAKIVDSKKRNAVDLLPDLQ